MCPEIEATAGVNMVNSFLEKSNVNPIEELIMTLEHQRNYETHVKFIDLQNKWMKVEQVYESS